MENINSKIQNFKCSKRGKPTNTESYEKEKYNKLNSEFQNVYTFVNALRCTLIYYRFEWMSLFNIFVIRNSYLIFIKKILDHFPTTDFFWKAIKNEKKIAARESASFIVWLRLSIHPLTSFFCGIRDQPMVAAVRWPPQTNTSLSLSLPRLSLSVFSRLCVLTVKKLANGWTYVEMVDPPRRMFPECGGRDL